MLPDSSLLNEESRAALDLVRELQNEISAALMRCPSMVGADPADIPHIRDCQARAFYATSGYRRICERYAVTVTREQIGGVETEIFVPSNGIATKNVGRVLINLHGGGFQIGSRTISQLESIPIASVGAIKVVSVDYRMAPEYRFPAATKDAVAVYRALLQDYAPQNIGIYGCSAGAVLTTETVALLHRQGLQLPAAIGLLCGAASYWTEGDSGRLDEALSGTFKGTAQSDPYFRDTETHDALAFPVQSSETLAVFPRSLLITATRDLALSSVIHTHSCLVRQGVKAYLHVWEGLGHAFHYFPDLPQSREVYETVVCFFDDHLGTRM